MNTKKTAITIVAAMMAIAMLTTVAMAIVCEKPCGTKVEQCDNETTFLLEMADDATIRESVHGTVYIDMADGETVSEGDVRLTWYHDYPPNTKVKQHDDDITGPGSDFKAEGPQDILTYADLSAKSALIGIFDLYDPVYVDLDDSETVSPGDIRITDVPPKDVYDGGGNLVYAAAHFAPRWTRVNTGDPDCQAGAPWPLWEIGTNVGDGQDSEGYPDELIGYVDADCDLEWSCADKLYINQPVVDPEGWPYDGWQFDYFVTIGDIRLYIPEDDPCIPECGTKVQQTAKDAVYALNVATGATWGYVDVKDNGVFDGAPTNEGAYIDMDNDGVVSAGDVRLTDNSYGLKPNTKVGGCEADIGDDMEVPDTCEPDDQVIFKYFDLDWVASNDPDFIGYSLGDPIYMDMDNSSDVSTNDVRISQSPVFAGQMPAPYALAGSIGDSYSRVLPFDFDALHDWPLAPLPDGDRNHDGTVENAEVEDLLGFIDSDCSGTWTCPDKLYLQQLVDITGWLPNQHDFFVTIGDFRLYIPPSAIAEGWPECGTKVEQCNIDLVYALLDQEDLSDCPCPFYAAYYDADDDGNYDYGDDIYLDMDCNDEVSVGDIRLSNCSTRYDPNTKVKLHDKDIGNDLIADDFTLVYADVNFNGMYDLADPLYLCPWYLGGLVDSIRLNDVPPKDVYDDDGDLVWAAAVVGEAWTRVKPGDLDASWWLGGPVWVDELENDYYIEDRLVVFDADCSGTWTCKDKLYLVQKLGVWDEYGWFPGYYVTAGDHRLYMPTEDGGPVTPDCPWDLNDDTNVDINDVLLMIPHWGTNWSPGDFSPDGNIDINDVIAMIPHWGPCP